MTDFTILTPSEQVATHLRGELFRGRWSGTIPGVPALAAELGVDRKTAALALAHLEDEGHPQLQVLTPPGAAPAGAGEKRIKAKN